MTDAFDRWVSLLKSGSSLGCEEDDLTDAFDPVTDIPTTDEEANVALQRGNELLTANLQGLYRCFRAEGETVLDAFQLVLEAHVAAIEHS